MAQKAAFKPKRQLAWFKTVSCLKTAVAFFQLLESIDLPLRWSLCIPPRPPPLNQGDRCVSEPFVLIRGSFDRRSRLLNRAKTYRTKFHAHNMNVPNKDVDRIGHGSVTRSNNPRSQF